MRKRLLAGLLAGLVLPAAYCLPSVARADWPRFRGPNGSGYAAGANTPAAFTEKDFNWKIDLPGVGHSSPVVVGQKVFVTCADPGTAKRFLICVDLGTGKELWRKAYDVRGFPQHKDNSFASASPAADGNRVYFSFTAQESYKVFCVDHSGADLWSYDMGPWKSQHGAGCSPIVVDGVVIVPNDQDGPTASLVGLDAATGSERWRTPRKNGLTATSTPCLFTPKGGGGTQVILASTAGGVSSVDPKSGKENWSIVGELNLGTLRSVSSPIATDELVMATWGQGGMNRQGVAIRPPAAEGGKAAVAFKWPSGKEYPYVPSPVVKDGLLFTWSDVGVVTCMRAATGERVWQEKAKASGARPEYYSSPIVAGDKLYNITKDGEVICLAAGETFKQLGQSSLGDRCHATPAVAGNALVIRTASHMVSVGR